MRLIVLVLYIGWSSCAAQITRSSTVSFSLPGVMLLDISPDNTGIPFTIAAPTEAGAQTTVFTNNSKWLQFSSAVATGITRSVLVQMTGTLPAGLSLTLTPSSYSGSGAGTLGTPSASLMLSGSSQVVVSGIGGAFTGNGSSDGFRLTYTLTLSNFALLRTQSSAVSIIYTIADN